MRAYACRMNYAFIDGQNLYRGTQESGWKIDHRRFRIYLQDKYKVDEARYFLGFVSDNQQGLYENLERAGFVLSFREHSIGALGSKKGNVDTDLVFEVMRMLVEKEKLDKAFIVSGDGDYKRLANFLIRKGKFGKMLFPNKKFVSSVYKKLGLEYVDYLGNENVRAKIARTSREEAP